MAYASKLQSHRQERREDRWSSRALSKETKKKVSSGFTCQSSSTQHLKEKGASPKYFVVLQEKHPTELYA